MMPDANAQPSPWDAIGLPATWTPTPFQWRFAKASGIGPAGPVNLHVIIFDTTGGREGFAFDADELRAFRDAITEQLGGIQVPQVINPFDSNGNRGN